MEGHYAPLFISERSFPVTLAKFITPEEIAAIFKEFGASIETHDANYYAHAINGSAGSADEAQRMATKYATGAYFSNIVLSCCGRPS